MADNVVNVIINGTNKASPVLEQVAADVENVGTSAKKTSAFLKAYAGGEEFTNFGKQWGYINDQAGKSIGVFGKLGGAFGKLGGTLKNVGGALGVLSGGILPALVMAGMQVISSLKEHEAALDDLIAKYKSMGNESMDNMAEVFNKVAVMRAKAAHDATATIELEAKAEIEASEHVRDKKIAAAQAELDKVTGLFANLSGERMAAEAKYTAARMKAEEDHVGKVILANEAKVAQLAVLEEKRRDKLRDILNELSKIEGEAAEKSLERSGKLLEAGDKHAENARQAADNELAKKLESIDKEFGATEKGLQAREAAEREHSIVVQQIEEETAAKRIQTIERMTGTALGIFAELGDDFKNVASRLSVAQFIQGAAEQIKQLEGFKSAIAGGDDTLRQAGVTTQMVDAAIKQLGADMQSAATTGVIPLHETTKAATETLKGAGVAARQAGADFRQMAADAAQAAQAMQVLNNARNNKDTGVRTGQSEEATRVALETTLNTQQRIDSHMDTLRQANDAIQSYDRMVSNRSTIDDPRYKIDYSQYPYNTKSAPTTGGGGGGMGSAGPQRYMVRTTPGGTTEYTGYAAGGQVPGPPTRAVPVLAHGREIIGQPEQIVNAVRREMGRSSGGGNRMREGVNVVIQAGAVQIGGSEPGNYRDHVEAIAQEVEARFRRFYG